MMAEPYRTTRIVEFHDTDMAGIMHFASFFQYMASTEHELLRSVGCSVYSLVEGQSIVFPRVSASCQFKSPVRCEQLLDVAVSISRIGGKSLTYEFKFTHEGSEVATGQMTSVCCREEHNGPMVPVPIPEEMADKLRCFVA